jgi:hypothetical protein
MSRVSKDSTKSHMEHSMNSKYMRGKARGFHIANYAGKVLGQRNANLLTLSMAACG